MNVQEFDTALSDLETRVDRLRALYENWFRGYEKLEPGVARKDVERRVYGLRKELPRNTALRFRYHQLYQRYTTLATYWQRTARQIEEGTYRLQLQRMKRRRPGDEDARTLAPPARAGEEGESNAPPSYELNLDETLDVRQLLDDIDLDQVARAIDVPGPHDAASPTPVAPSAVRATARFGRPSLGPKAATASPLASRRPASGEGAAAEPSPEGAAAAHSSGAPGARPSIFSPRAEPARTSVPADPLRPEVANSNATPAKNVQTFAKPGALKVPPIAPPAMLKPGSPPAFASPATGTGARNIPPAPPPSAPGTGQHAAPPRAPSAPGPGSSGAPAAPAPAARPAQPSLAPPLARAAQPSLSPPVARPAQPSAAPPPSAAARVPAGPRPAATAASPSSDALGEQRMRRLYDEYAAARRKNNEGDVRYETLASSIQKMLPDLSKKHQGKQIDFEVVLKDGRVGLKPKAT